MFKKLVSIGMVIIMLVSMSTSVFAAEKGTTSEDTEKLKQLITKTEYYLEKDSNGQIYFNYEKAVNNNESKEILEIGKIYNEMKTGEIQGDYKNINRTKREILDIIPKYGNWCGPGDKGKAPIDILDKQCKVHDNCYAKKGQWNTECDVQLVGNVASNFGKIRKIGGEAQAYAVGIIILFSSKVGGTSLLKGKYPELAPFLP